MVQSQPNDSLRTAADWQELRPTWPSWVLSAVAHAVLLILAYSLGAAVQRGLVEEPARRVGIVLAPPRSEAPAEDAAPASSASEPSADPPSLTERIAGDQTFDATELLPTRRTAIGAGAEGATTGVAGMERGSGKIGNRGENGVRTSVFGVEAQGNNFAYVFDRSGSMGGSGKTLLAAAKAELLRSLAELGDLQQFQIIFYYEHPTIMRLANQPGRMVLATDANKKLAKSFLGRIAAGGATEHEEALAMAVKLHPDVIFFLTDADEPAMSADQLARIRRLNDARTTIHAIEFGHGPKIGGQRNFIVQLAEQNGGTYRYVDVTRLFE